MPNLYTYSDFPTMKRLLLLVLCLLPAMASIVAARPADWQVQAGSEILQAQLSGNGANVICITDAEKDNVRCIATKTGAVVWTATVRIYGSGFYGKFVDNNVYLLANGNQYEFRAVADGAVLHSLPVAGASWDDLRGVQWDGATGLAGYEGADYEEVRTRFFGEIGIFYFSKGFQIVHLGKREVLFQSVCAASSVRYEGWNNLLLVIPKDCTKAFVLDTAGSELVYSMELDSRELVDDMVQHFVATRNQMFLFQEKSVLCIDLAKKSVVATINIELEKADSYAPIASTTELYLVVSYDNTQSLYRCSDGERQWVTKEEAVPGVVDVARLYTNDKDLVLFTYTEFADANTMGVRKLDLQTGQLLWTKELFELDGEYFPGHIRPVDMEAVKGWGLAFGLIGMGLASSTDKDFPEHMKAPNLTALRYGIAPFKSSVGYAYLLDTANQSQLVIAMGGQIYTELQQVAVHNGYDGEGFVVLDLRNGAVVSHTPMPIIGDLKKKGEYNAVLLMTIVRARQADVVMGAHDIYTVHNQKVSRISFDREKDRIAYIHSLPDEVFFSVNHNKEFYQYWRLSAEALPAKTTLCARSVRENFIFPDTTTFACMVKYSDEELAGFQLQTGGPGESRDEAALWALNEDDIDNMELGSFRGKSGRRKRTVDSLQGIRVIDGDVYLIGGDGFGRISADGRCRWSVPWEIQRREWTYSLSRIGSWLVFSSGDDTRILAIGCDKPTTVAKHDISYGDVEILTDRTKEIIVLDKSEGILYGYHVK